MLWAGIELATSLRSCLPQLLLHAELWLTVAQRKSFNAIPHNFEKRCNVQKRSRGRETVRLLCDFDDTIFTRHPSQYLRLEDDHLARLNANTKDRYETGYYDFA
jgi:hypothetical protein